MRRILMLSYPDDSHLPPVIEELKRRGVASSVFNPAQFPDESRLVVTSTGGWTGSISTAQETIDLSTISSVWRRRPQPYQAPTFFELGEQKYIEEEADQALTGVLDALTVDRNVLWVSRTHHVRKAGLKPLQLSAAHRLGLRTPPTLITNEPEAVRAFYDEHQGNIVFKTLGKGTIRDEEGQIAWSIYTSRVGEPHLKCLDMVQVTAHQFQEYIEKRLEVRVVVIGRQLFAAEIYSQHSERAMVDFRQGYDELRYAVHALPDEMRQKCIALVRTFDLQFASMDFILTPEGEYVFLDLNPNGQYYWLQLRLPKLTLKEAMADLLAEPQTYMLIA